MKRIIFNFYNFGLGGIQRRLVDIANYIVRDGRFTDWEVHFLLRDKRRFNFEKLIRHPRIIVHYMPHVAVFRFRLPFSIYLFWQVVQLKPRVIMGNLEIMSCYAVLIKWLLFWRRIRVVINQGNILSFDIGDHINKFWVRLCYPKADVVIVQTRYAREDLMHNFQVPIGRIHVIQNWTLVRSDVKPKPVYDLIYCGRFSKQKNLLLMLEIVKQVTQLMPNLKMLMMGDGDEKELINLKIYELGLTENVVVKQTSHQVYDYLLKSKLFMLTSNYEGHPVTLLEAMACQTVPVVLHYPGVSEYLRHDITGYIEKSQEAMAERIINLLSADPKRLEIAAAAAAEVKQHYGVKNLEKYIHLLFPITE